MALVPPLSKLTWASLDGMAPPPQNVNHLLQVFRLHEQVIRVEGREGEALPVLGVSPAVFAPDAVGEFSKGLDRVPDSVADFVDL